MNTAYSNNSCGNLWLTEDGQRLLNACGAVYRTTESSDDFSANGRLTSTTGVKWAAHSVQQHEIAVVVSQSATPGQTDDTKLQLYRDDALEFASQLSLPNFPAGNSSFVGHGRFVFWNAAETKLMVVQQADSTSNLLSDYGIYTVDLSSGVANCDYQLGSTSVTSPASGTSAVSLSVSVRSGCGWAALSSVYWAAVTSGSSGDGSGTVKLSIAASYSNSPRSGSLIVAGKTVAINQDGIVPCTYTPSVTSASAVSAGASGTFSVTTSNSMCAWTATSNASWLNIADGVSGSGPGSVTYNVAPNLGAAPRTANISISGTSVVVTQAALVSSTSPGLRFVPLAPCRVVDTRLAAGAFGGPSLAGRSSRDFSLPTAPCDIPSNAKAYSLNVTVVPHGPLAYVTVWPAGTTRPDTSALNSYDGRVRANAVVIPAGQDGSISVFATDDTEIILDVNGYFVDETAALVFFPLTPCRIVDTRVGLGVPLGGPMLFAGVERSFPLRAGSCNIPLSAQAYSLNYTVVPKRPLGYLTSWPSGQTRPVVSTLNASTGVVTANAAIVPAGSNGYVSVFVTDPTDFIIDINGYFAPPGTGGLSLYPTGPCRVFDTRTQPGGQAFNGVLDVNVQTSTCNLPTSAQAYVLNATVVPTASLAYLSLWPSGDRQPVVSTLNSQDGAVAANMAIVPTSGGSVSAFASDYTHLILDITGYFAP